MNYDMQGMELIPELFIVLKTAKGRNQEGASSVDGLTRPLVSKGVRARRETSYGWQTSCRYPRLNPNPRLSASIVKETVTGSGITPNAW